MNRWLLGGLLLLAGCDSQVLAPNVACLAIEVPAIVVLVRDSATGAPAAYGAVGVTDRLRRIGGSVRDTLHLTRWTGPDISSETAIGLSGYGPSGVYNVRVEKSGYRPWTTDNVNVEGAVCGVLTVELNAHLQPN